MATQVQIALDPMLDIGAAELATAWNNGLIFLGVVGGATLATLYAFNDIFWLTGLPAVPHPIASRPTARIHQRSTNRPRHLQTPPVPARHYHPNLACTSQVVAGLLTVPL